MTRHTLSVLVEDQPGVLARIASLFSRRGFNIESLAVGPTEHAGMSRMTIAVNVDDLPLEQVTKQLNKLVNVLKIVELDPATSVQRELLLVKVKADSVSRSQVLETVQLFGDLLERLTVDRNDDRHARHRGIVRLANRQRVDVEAAPCEQTRHPREDARLVLDEHGKRVLAHL
jgi:acetolactate synthase small subunit